MHITHSQNTHLEQPQIWTFTHPDSDRTPFDYLATVNKTLLCDPGECCAYSSIGYILLGLLIAFESGAKHWTAFDQLSVLPTPLQTELRAQGIDFPKLGKCSEYPHICHQYAAWHVDGEQALHFFDIDGCVYFSLVDGQQYITSLSAS